VLDGREMIL